MLEKGIDALPDFFLKKKKKKKKLSPTPLHTPLHLHQQLELLMQGRSDECFHAKLSVVKPSQHNVFNIDI